MELRFQGFTKASFDFFAELAENNNKSWFDQNRARYEQHVVGAFRSLLQELTPFLRALNPHFEVGGKTNANFSRINRDIRFSKDKTPYKSSYYLSVYDGRHERGYAGRLYVGLCADCLTVGFAIYGSFRGPKNALDLLFRKRLLSHYNLFTQLLSNIVRARKCETYWHREEKGEWTQHPGLPRCQQDWQTLHAWIVRKVFLPKARGTASVGFARQVESLFAQLYPLYVFTSVASPQCESDLARALRLVRRR